MADLQTRLTKKALLLGKIETTIGVDAVPSHLTDALEIEEPDYQIDPQILERNYVADDLSPFANVIGRKQATITFTTEIKGNGRQQSGNVADAPVMANLFRSCGYELLAMNSAATQIMNVVADFDNDKVAPPTDLAWAKAGTITLTKPILYTITVTTGGASGVAEVSIASNALDEDDTSADVPVVVTSGSPLTIGGSGATLTPTWTGNLVVGDIYRVLVNPMGLRLKPISNNQPTLTLYLYMDGVLHKMTAALGNFEVTAEAGNIAKVTFTYQGNFVTPTDAAAPSEPVFDTTLPSQVELSNLTWGSQRDLVCQQWTFNQANTLTPRPDVNAKEGVKSVRITARSPEGGMNPEATTEADHPFWDEIERGKTQTFFARIGKTVGNIVAVFMPKAQLSALPYGDRDGLRTYDTTFRCTRNAGNDEVEWFLV